MAFIGVITEHKKESYVKKIIENNLKNKKVTVLIITEKNIANIRNIKFETIIMTRQVKEEEALKNILKNAKYLIINADMRYNLTVLQEIELTVITYGFNTKSTITISSIEEGNLLICIQRNIIDVTGKKIEPQELDLAIQEIETEKNIDIIMGTIITLLIYGQRKLII